MSTNPERPARSGRITTADREHPDQTREVLAVPVVAADETYAACLAAAVGSPVEATG